MKNFLIGEAYYLKKDTTTKGICLLFLVASIVLFIWAGSNASFDVSSPLQPISMISPLSLFFYFIIPIHTCFFSTEGFEYGSIKNIIAFGQSRSSYIMGKYISEIKAVIWFVFQFYGVFYVLYMGAAFITGSHIGIDTIRGDMITALSLLGLNILYLSAYSAIVMMVGVIVRKTTSASVITFVIVFGDFMLGGYLKDSSSGFLRMISENTLTTQIMKFSRIYIMNSQRILLSGTKDYVIAVLIPIIIIAICLAVALFSFEKRDIHS